MTIYVPSANVPITNWYDEVLPHVPGCLEAVALNAIRQAIGDFCDRTWILHGEHTPINVVAGQASSAYVPPPNRLVVKRIEVWHGTQPLIDKQPDDFKSLFEGNWMTAAGTPRYHTGTSSRSIRLVPIPTANLTAGLTMRVAYGPTPVATDIDAIVWEDYHEEVAAGARMRLHMMADKPWTDLKKAAIEKQMNDDGIDKCFAKVQRGFGRARRRVRGHYF